MGYRTYSPCNGFLVSADGTGDFKTITAAIAAATSGKTIFVNRGTYTENFTMKSNVDIVGLSGEISGDLATNVLIVGTITVDTNVNALIQGLALKSNSATVISVTAAPASGSLNINNCFFFLSNGDGFNNLSSAYGITVSNCTVDISSGSAKLFNNVGSLSFVSSYVNNSGASTTASTNSGTVLLTRGNFNCAFASSSAGAYTIVNSIFSGLAAFTTLTTAGTGSSSIINSGFTNGNNACVSIGTGTSIVITNSTFSSSATNAITGAGTLSYTGLSFTNSSGNNVSTQTALTSQMGAIKAGGVYTNSAQPAFFAYQSANITNATGNATAYQLGATALTEKFDRATNFNTNGTFTAPVAGIYYFYMAASVANLSAAMTEIDLTITASAVNYNGSASNAFATQGLTFSVRTVGFGTMVSMAAGDTAVAKVTVSGGAGNTATVLGSSSPNTFFLGYLVA